MKILQLCKKFPYPLKDGESIAVSYLAKALVDLGCEITLLCMNTTKHYLDIEDLPADYNHYKEIHFTELDNSVKPLEAIKNLFSKDSFHVVRFISQDFTDKLVDLLKRETFDIVQLETLYLAPYVDTIREHSDALITMRAHNVEHEIWERITQNTKLLPKRLYLSYLAKKLKRFEVNSLNDYDYLIAVTNRDLNRFKKLGYRNGAAASPIGIDVNAYEAVDLDFNKISLSFIGSLDWMPNLEGVDWFLNKVWNTVSQRFDDIELHIAGRNTPDHIKALKNDRLIVHGEVPSAMDFINSHPIMIVPLFSGSGMRVKILEGLVLGRIIITTSVGLEGIHAEHKKEVLIADTPEEFMECIRYCYEHPKQLQRISNQARQFVHRHYNNHSNAHDLKSLYTSLLQKYKSTPSDLVVEK